MKFLTRSLWQFVALLGVEHNLTSHLEKWLAALGALLAIYAVAEISSAALSGISAGLMIASMGASAVLLFVVPHGALSQPWPVLGGHLLSAALGVTCRLLIPDPWLASAAAVSASILTMQYLRCVHPPGGATALVAVTGGPRIEELGYFYILDPVALNVAVMLLGALVFNNLFEWRRYPAALHKRQVAFGVAHADHRNDLTQEDFEAAMHKLNTFVDISTEELIELVDLARQHAEESRPPPSSIEAGRCYSNGLLGRHWGVRQIIDQEHPGKHDRKRVIYKVLAGEGAWQTGICASEEFRRWARFEVQHHSGRWVRVKEAPQSAA
jgi:CBS-domain-containing membrane protein